MKGENQVGIGTAGDLVGVLSDRERQNDSAGQRLLDYLEMINSAQRVLDADTCKSIQAVTSLLEASIIKKDPTVRTFATELIVYLAGGGKASEFFDQPQNRHWEALSIENIIEPEVIIKLHELPATTVPLLEAKPIDLKVKPIIEAGYKKPTQPENGVTADKTAQNLNINRLLDNSILWVHSEGKKYTSLANVAALLIGNKWDEDKLLLAKAILKQTVIPKWQNSSIHLDEDVGVMLKQTGRNLMLTFDQVKDLTKYMQVNLGTKIHSRYQIVDEQIYNWPSESKKKASRN
jgi:hypothetical protein